MEKLSNEASTEIPHASKSTKLINKIVVIALIFIALSLGLFLKWSIQDPTVLEIKNAPFPARIIHDDKTGYNVLILTLDYCKNIETNGELRISYVSPTREIFLPLSRENSPVGCIGKKDYPILIPVDIPADTYRVKFRVTYSINPVKSSVTQIFESNEIKIEPPVSFSPAVGPAGPQGPQGATGATGASGN